MYFQMVGLPEFYDKFVCNSMVVNGKPAPDIYLKACQELDLPPEECVALEDSPNGIESAFSAGCLPVMVPDLSQPDEHTASLLYKKIDTLDMLIPILEKENKGIDNTNQE